MEMSENIFDFIKKFLGENFNIVEESVDINTQLEYLEFSRRNVQNDNLQAPATCTEILYAEHADITDKRHALVNLAACDTVESYRMLEKYAAECSAEMTDWAKIALRESRLFMESSLLEQKQVIVATGLGGKDSKLRFHAVFRTKINQDFTEFQQNVFKREVEFFVHDFGGELEEIEFKGYIASVLVLMPITKAIKAFLPATIEEINKYGNFLHTDIMMNNVKKYTFDEIEKFFNEQDKEKNKEIEL